MRVLTTQKAPALSGSSALRADCSRDLRSLAGCGSLRSSVASFLSVLDVASHLDGTGPFHSHPPHPRPCSRVVPPRSLSEAPQAPRVPQPVAVLAHFVRCGPHPSRTSATTSHRVRHRPLTAHSARRSPIEGFAPLNPRRQRARWPGARAEHGEARATRGKAGLPGGLKGRDRVAPEGSRSVGTIRVERGYPAERPRAGRGLSVHVSWYRTY